MTRKWTSADVPDQSGRIAVITGANSGLGYDTAAVLADKGAHVVLAVRNLDKGRQAADRIKAASPNAVVALQQLDLSSLDSIRTAADELRAAHPRIDLLINNAGVMYVPKRETTKDGFEMQFGTNHLGHFALTGLLLDNMLSVDGSRVVTVSSNGHKFPLLADIYFDDLQFERGYHRIKAYGQSKLANLLFTYDLQRRLKLKGAPHRRTRRASRFRRHRTDAQSARRHPVLPVEASHPAGRQGRAADTASRDRPRRPRWSVLRTRRHRGDQG